MGLAAKRKRVKLSHDPNNTKWTRDTESFGHKTLRAQGWQPGELLGAKESAHFDSRTRAHSSHIRVAMKDDKLGLGAKRGSGLAEGECTGLDVFQNILGRLNGKDEAKLVTEQKNRENFHRVIYNENRRGLVRFVKGGFLVGDKIEELAKEEESHIQQMAERIAEDSIVPRDESKSEFIPTQHKKQRSIRKENKSIKMLLKKSIDTRIEDQSSQVSLHGTSEELVVVGELGNSKKRREQAEYSTSDINMLMPSARDKKRKVKKKGKDPRKHGEHSIKTQPSTVVIADTSYTPQSLSGGRHAIRSRNIAQKRLAVLDTASLDQIFMIRK